MFKLYDSVKHPHPKCDDWGVGIIVGLSEGNPRVTIRFKQAGFKTLSLDHVSLIHLLDQKTKQMLSSILKPSLGYYKSNRMFPEKDSSNDFSQTLIEIKNKNINIIKQYSEKVLSLLELERKWLAGCILCTAPSSNKENIETGITIFSDHLLQKFTLTNGIHLLKRIQTIDKSATSKIRHTKEDHLNTIAVQNKDMIRNKRILLIDDIETTGATINACDDLLMHAGAAEVIQMCLGKTVYRPTYDKDLSHPARKKQSDYFSGKLNLARIQQNVA
jgi:hypothetical protein